MGATLQTAHGPLALPVFLPDATRAVVRAVDPDDLRRCGIRALVVNAFHLATHPGASVVEATGGIHRFMGFDGPILCDSGGYQVWSLLQEDPKRGRVSRDGFQYKPPGRDEKRWLTPEKAIKLQFDIGADILVCLDHCTHPDAPAEEQRASVEHTVAWAKTCREEFEKHAARLGRRPLLFAVVQGGNDPALRVECLERLVEIGFDGFGFGGRPVTDDGALIDAVSLVAKRLPPQVPKWGLGIGKPEHVETCLRLGYDVFDCVLPTRDARQRRLYVFRDPAGRDAAYDYLYLRDEAHVRDARPIDPSCDAPCCRNFSRAYLHHLFEIEDALAPRLATLHNLRFYARLLERLAP